jgi:hypothetical protein
MPQMAAAAAAMYHLLYHYKAYSLGLKQGNQRGKICWPRERHGRRAGWLPQTLWQRYVGKF